MWSLSTVILEPRKIKPVTVFIVSQCICHELMEWDAMILIFLACTYHIKTILKKKICKNLSEKALQITVKSKGEKERYTHLNIAFQTIARRGKKAFLRDQCKEIEENIRVVKTRDCFKKIRDREGMFQGKMGTIKERHGMDITEAEDIKKRWQEYTELYKKDLHDPDNHDGVITHLEPHRGMQSQVGLRKHYYEQS